MNKISLLIFALLMISASSNCQWYQRQYGVKDINLLSAEQLNEVITKSRTGLVFGAVFSIPATIGIIAGLVMQKAPYPESLGKSFAGLAYIIFSVPPEILGLTLIGIHSSRIKSIKEIQKMAEIKIGFINYPVGKDLIASGDNILPCISITFRF